VRLSAGVTVDALTGASVDDLAAASDEPVDAGTEPDEADAPGELSGSFTGD